jgi:hypothetical protein
MSVSALTEITAWNGIGISQQSLMVETGQFLPTSLRVELPFTPKVTTPVHLPVGTVLVRLYSATATIWYVLDRPLGLLAPPTSDPEVFDTAFHTGDMLMAGWWQSVQPPLDNVSHVLNLASEEISPTVVVVALQEVF